MTSTARPVAVTDTTDMVVVHRLFRREFRRLPAFVAAAATADAEGLRRIENHARELVSGLHHHHAVEDDLLWPLLRDRVTVEGALVARMAAQHERLGGLLGRAEALLDRIAARDVGELVGVLDQVPDLLDEHLDEEEREVLPLVRRCVTPDEWARLGERGLESIPPSRRLIALGHILEGADARERTVFLTKAPLPARLLFPLLGERRARREKAALERVLVP